MNGQNQREERNVRSTVAGVAIGAAAVYAGYKLFNAFFGANEPHQNQPNPDEGDPPQSIPFRITSPHRFPEQSKIYVVNTPEECKYAMKELKSHCDEFGVLGFDCEWVSQQSVGRNPIALLQLTSHRGLCVLVRLFKLQYIPEELKEILVDRSIVKVGVAIVTDAKYLFEDYLRQHDQDNKNPIRSMLELGHMADKIESDGRRRSLAWMSETYLGVTLNKSPEIRCSNWEADTLTALQITYAAKDALVSIELFKFFADKIEPSSTFSSDFNRMQKVFDAFFEYLDVDV